MNNKHIVVLFEHEGRPVRSVKFCQFCISLFLPPQQYVLDTQEYETCLYIQIVHQVNAIVENFSKLDLQILP